MNRRHLRVKSGLLLAALALVAVATACQALDRVSPSPTPTPPSDIYAVLEAWSDLSQATPSVEGNAIVEVWNILSQEFVEDVDAAALSEGAIAAMEEATRDEEDGLDADALSDAAIEGMLDALGDPYTSYLDPDAYHIALDDIRGQFEGIGAHVGLRNGRITIIAPLPDSPAEGEGILPGDVILEVEGASTEGWSLMEAIIKIRGPKGTPVRLLVQHQDAPEPTLIEITRDVIKMESVYWEMLPEGIALLRISGFAEDTNEELAEALGEIAGQDALGIVLDLRNNPGGLLSTTVEVTSQFLTEGLVLYEMDGDGDRTAFEVRPGGLAPDIPMAVLVNGFSASGSEVLAGALQDHERAVLIGTTTFGKGSVNLPRQLSNGSGLYFTVGRWYSPNGRLIEGMGLKPDIWVEGTHTGDGDPQLERALEYLGAQVVAASR